MDPSSPRTLDEIERRLDDRVTQLQQQRKTDMDAIRSLLRAEVERRGLLAVKVLTVLTLVFKQTRLGFQKCIFHVLMMVRLASIHLDGLALKWHLNYMRQKFDIYPSWKQYVSDVTARFGDAYEDPLSYRLLIKHTGKIQDYVDQFELPLTHVSLLPEHSLSIFLAGLEQNTQLHVRMFNPTSIAHAANLAKLHEASLPTNQRTSSRFFPFSKNQGLFIKPTISSSTTPQSPSTTTNSTFSPTTKPLLNLTTHTYFAIEIAERRSKGLCMFCDEQFTPGHQFKHKRSQIMVLELDDDDTMVEEPTEETNIPESDSLQAFENAQLSLQALTGIANYHTMRVTGIHDKKSLQILLDSGSTHNFLDLEIAKSLGCKLEAI
ncbi:retrotransposon-related protein [Trifolium pratense]|uniref:Retrotransposon-related protein n=1 Tax=Trifolium pratense TaxID=57577 RepID=A0A2K3KY02_TRIPR|nr:retrotransposon-related protein [Trifolium pratense]